MPFLDRRAFLKQTAAAGVLVLSSNPRAYAENNAITIAQIGLGGRGQSVGREMTRRSDVRMAWICDPDDERGASYPGQIEQIQGRAPKRTRDMRHIFDDPAVDAVIISTCDHWHALATVWACQAGKDVYVEKPASNNVWEGRKMVEAARKYNRIVQTGTQNRSAEYVIRAREYIDRGGLGKLAYVKVYNMKFGGPYHEPPDSETPSSVDYDLYLGPAPARPFNRGHFHDGWKKYWAYSGGDLADDGVHQLDIARYLIGKGFPRSVQGVGGKFVYDDDREVPDTQSIVYEYDDLVMTFELTQWADYMRKTPGEIRNTDQFPQWDLNATRIELFGTKGKMVLGRHGGGWQAVDESGQLAAQEYGRMADPEHQADFIDAIRTRRTPNASIEDGHRSAALVHLGNMTGRLGNRKLTFDSDSETCGSDAEANALLKGTYRAPYIVPEKV